MIVWRRHKWTSKPVPDPCQDDKIPREPGADTPMRDHLVGSCCFIGHQQGLDAGWWLGSARKDRVDVGDFIPLACAAISAPGNAS